MNKLPFEFSGHQFEAMANGTLYLPKLRVLVVSDLHLGKSERIARRSGQLIPPYETEDTLSKLEEAINAVEPKQVVCLGDSFDDLQAGINLNPSAISALHSLMAGRDWVWIEGNHDPGPLDFGGTHLTRLHLGSISLCHIATDTPESGEISGHYHPKARIKIRSRTLSRPCFLVDERRIIMPSFGTYTGGLLSSTPVLSNLMSKKARAILTGPAPHIIPMPR